jgi:hypothetical protein
LQTAELVVAWRSESKFKRDESRGRQALRNKPLQRYQQLGWDNIGSGVRKSMSEFEHFS